MTQDSSITDPTTPPDPMAGADAVRERALAMLSKSVDGNPVEDATAPATPAAADPDVAPVSSTEPNDGIETAGSSEGVLTGLEGRIEAKQFAMLWHPLLSGIASAADRSEAAEQIVQQFTTMLPDHIVRMGWSNVATNSRKSGKKHESTSSKSDDKSKPAVEVDATSQPGHGGQPVLHKVLDSRLGWLGDDNSVFQSLLKSFEKTDTQTQPIRYESANLVLELGTELGSAQRASIWIRPPQSSGEELERFSRMIPVEVLSTTGSVFFSRPSNARLGRFGASALRWWSHRASLGIAVLTLAVLSCIPVAYRVDATATVTAMDSRRVASPIDATLLHALVRPGDFVKMGEALLELDGRPLRIELETLTAEIEEATKEEDIALAGGEIAEAQLAGLRRQTLSRRRDLIIDRLDKLVVVSPIDGVVIQGDLQHSLGTPLEIGQTLLEIAPRDSVEIELEIPEVEIGFVDSGTPVQLWFPAVGRSTFYSSISKVYPSATIRDDENVFVAKTPMPKMNQDAVQHRSSGAASEHHSGSGIYGVDAGRVLSSDEFAGGLEQSGPTSEVDMSASDEPTAVNELRVGMRGEAVVLGPKRPWVWKWIRLPVRRVGWLIGW
ncbi:Barrel-sandwich domain of CusB or HlyD membrane-fusion [Neorhodopirellula lusitana]|uniref:Barrel-sandwich domain of CusB or HlyD membrane-fusion n=1 Tax=Neorhodopirellula lusitana TaxID=445327 RepID=A0ABY1QFA3_9BACT|nr:HlyD family efflux transporter periplasmic adaptor subunit [Neorhodopirellula lusitana]SMP69623.1 Barrel-sandwich domain of CusB or HlyD membrane-fusion [Neorhodopirellula lusitana]